MAQPTESRSGGSAAGALGPAVAILATAPRPGLVLNECCPPLTPTEAGALQTAWLKQVVRELPGAATFLFGRPDDARPMLQYFAGPGVELRPWPVLGRDVADPFLAAAAELFAAGHAPVLVRAVDAPEPDQAAVLACLDAARQGAMVWAPDQRGAPWLCGFAAASQLQRSPGTTVRRGPWARTVRTADDFGLLLHERQPAKGAPPQPCPLAVRDLQSALQFFEVVFGCELLAREPHAATVAHAMFRLRLLEHGERFARNGLCIEVRDLDLLHRQLTAPTRGKAHDVIAAGDELAVATDGRADFAVTDPNGNRLTFRAPAAG